jgi:ABC-type Fe3+-hydroxamate transport system substrate-binding protein
MSGMASPSRRGFGVLVLGGLAATGLAATGLAARGLAATARGAAIDTSGRQAARRVASLDWALAETLVALGHPPIAVPDTRGYAEWVVAPALPPDTANLGSRYTPNVELLAALRPDLVVAIPYQGPLLPVVERVAPTLTLSIYEADGSVYERAVAVTARLAAAVGDPEAGPALVARTQAAFAAARRRIARRPRRPVYVLSLLDPHHAWIYGAGSLFTVVLRRLGLDNAWTGETNAWGFSAIGLEALADGDPEARLVVLQPLPPDVLPRLATNPLWQRIPFVRRGPPIFLPVLTFGGLPSAARFADLFSAALAEEPA